MLIVDWLNVTINFIIVIVIISLYPTETKGISTFSSLNSLVAHYKASFWIFNIKTIFYMHLTLVQMHVFFQS